MVFLSTCQVLLGRNPFGVGSGAADGEHNYYSPPRSVFTTFGTRRLTQRMAVEEIASGMFVVIPISLMVAFFAKRFAASGFLRPHFVRRDVWTTLVITIVGDLFLELLLPSLQCLPTEHPFDAYANASPISSSSSPGGYFPWLMRAWGFHCPADPYVSVNSYRDEYNDDTYYDNDPNSLYYHQQRQHYDPASVLSTDAVGTLLTLRLIFMCVGVYLGESFCPVVLTGGIACGKSTVGRLLVANNSGGGDGAGGAGDNDGGGDDGVNNGGAPASPGHSMAGPYKARRGGGPSSRRGGTSKQANKKAKSAASELNGLQSNPTSSSSAATSSSYDDGEGSVLIVDTDKIAHQILLPPSVLSSGGQQPQDRGNWNVIGGAGGGSSSNLSFSHDDSHEMDGDDVDEEDDYDDDVDENGSAGALHPSSSTTSPTRRQQQQQQNRNRRRSRRQPSRRRVRYVVSAADSVYDKVVDAFGDESVDCRNILTPDGMIDRDKLGAIVFGNRELRRRLNSITHPRIFVTMMRQLVHGSYFSPQDIVCADIPLFFETMSGLRRMFGLVVVVACTKEVQFQRLRKRNPDLTAEQCWERINSQLPISEKAELADLVIWNNGSVEDLEQEVERVRKEIVGRLYGIGMSLLQMLLLVGGSLSLAVSSKLFTSFSA